MQTRGFLNLNLCSSEWDLSSPKQQSEKPQLEEPC